MLRGLEEWRPSVSWLLILSASDYGTAGVAALDSIGAVAVGVVTSGAVASFVGAIGSVDRLFVKYVGFVVGTAPEQLVLSIGWLLVMSMLWLLVAC